MTSLKSIPIKKDDISIRQSFCLLRNLIPDMKSKEKVRVELLGESIERSFVVNYFDRSCGNPA